MKLYTSGQVVRVVLLSVAGTAILATTIFFCNKEKILKSNNTQSEYNNEVTVSEEKNDFLLEKDETMGCLRSPFLCDTIEPVKGGGTICYL